MRRGFTKVVQPESGAEVGVCRVAVGRRGIFWGAAEKGDRYIGTINSKELSAQGLHSMKDGAPEKEFKE